MAWPHITQKCGREFQIVKYLRDELLVAEPIIYECKTYVLVKLGLYIYNFKTEKSKSLENIKKIFNWKRKLITWCESIEDIGDNKERVSDFINKEYRRVKARNIRQKGEQKKLMVAKKAERERLKALRAERKRVKAERKREEKCKEKCVKVEKKG